MGCVKCPMNTYSDVEDATECIACPDQGTTEGTGANSADLCVASNAGKLNTRKYYLLILLSWHYCGYSFCYFDDCL